MPTYSTQSIPNDLISSWPSNVEEWTLLIIFLPWRFYLCLKFSVHVCFRNRDVLPDQRFCPWMSRVSEPAHKESRGKKQIAEKRSSSGCSGSCHTFSLGVIAHPCSHTPNILNKFCLAHYFPLMLPNSFCLAVFASQELGGRGCVTKTMASYSVDMLSKLRSQREAGLFCDITLRTNGRPFLAHRAVLAAVSDHFKEIFTEMDLNMEADVDLTGKNRRR